MQSAVSNVTCSPYPSNQIAWLRKQEPSAHRPVHIDCMENAVAHFPEKKVEEPHAFTPANITSSSKQSTCAGFSTCETCMQNSNPSQPETQNEKRLTHVTPDVMHLRRTCCSNP